MHLLFAFLYVCTQIYWTPLVPVLVNKCGGDLPVRTRESPASAFVNQIYGAPLNPRLALVEYW